MDRLRPARAWECPDPLDWGGYLLRPRLRLYPKDLPAPALSAIYGLFAADGRLVYVGLSVDLSARIPQHLYRSLRGWRGTFAFYGFRPTPEHMLRDLEVAHIHALRPEQNRSYERPEWAPHHQMVDALRSLWDMPGENRAAKRTHAAVSDIQLPQNVFPKGRWYYLVTASGKKRIWTKLTLIRHGLGALIQRLEVLRANA